MSLLARMFPALARRFSKSAVPNEPAQRSDERGSRATPEDQLKYLYRIMWVDPDLRQAILDIREMDRLDGRVKRIHSRIARDVVRGGLELQQAKENKRLADLWQQFGQRGQLDRPGKLKSDARGFVMEGNLPLQIVLDDPARRDPDIAALVRMPSETILPNVNEAGRFKDVTKAYVQFDVLTGAERAAFPLWKLFVCRFDPDNYDDMGSLGRPFMDANRSIWQKLRMTDEDLIIRRRVRAPLRLAHSLEGASKEQLEEYEAKVKKDQTEITTDYFSNKKLAVQPVQGDANLDQMADIVYLLDSFFAGTPLPKALMGFTEGTARDILEDLKRDYFDEVDLVQDELAFAYEAAFRLQLLFKGINPASEDFAVTFAERRTETLNQTADRGLKMRALGFPEGMVWEEMGYNAAYVRQRREWELENVEPYPGGPGMDQPQGTARVKITPGNAPKGDSATSITNR